jgi:flagellar basal body rod protein FlgC
MLPFRLEIQMDLFAIATSGMQAAAARLDVSASNIARDTEETPVSSNGTAAQPAQSTQLLQFSLVDGGVGVQAVQGGSADLGLDLVTQMMALDQFKANAQVFQTGEDAMRSLLSIKA